MSTEKADRPADVNVLQFLFAGMWKLTEDMPMARKMLIAAAEGYNRQMAEINGGQRVRLPPPFPLGPPFRLGLLGRLQVVQRLPLGQLRGGDPVEELADGAADLAG